MNDEGFGPALAMFFIASVWNGTPKVMEPDKCDQLDWFHPDELPTPTVPYVANALADVQRGRNCHGLDAAFSTFGWNADR